MQIQVYMIAIVHNLKRLASGVLDGAFWVVMRLSIAVVKGVRLASFAGNGILAPS